MAAAKVSIGDEKRRMIAESDRYRQAMTVEFQNIKAATAWVPKTAGVIRATSPFLALAAPLIGLFVKRKNKAEPKAIHNGKAETQGLVAKTLLAFEIFRKIRPFWDNFQQARRRRTDQAQAQAAPKTPLSRK